MPRRVFVWQRSLRIAMTILSSLLTVWTRRRQESFARRLEAHTLGSIEAARALALLRLAVGRVWPASRTSAGHPERWFRPGAASILYRVGQHSVGSSAQS